MPEMLLSLDQIADGSLFLEAFSGAGVLNSAVQLADCPCLRPWDIRFGQEFNVLLHGSAILTLAAAGKIGCTWPPRVSP